MIGSGLSVVIELIVSLLLVVTIGYCFIVNKKLTALRTDQTGLRQVIVELNRSSDRAEQAISQMRQTAQSVDGEMASNVEAARQAREGLQEVLERTRQIRTIAEKLAEMDISSLKSLERASRDESAMGEQAAVSKELKRQRLGFGRDQFKMPLQESEALVRQQAAALEQAHRHASAQLNRDIHSPPLPPMTAGTREMSATDDQRRKPVFGKKQKWMSELDALANSGSLTPADLVMQARQQAGPAEMSAYRESA